MDVFRTPDEVRAFTRAHRAAGRTVGFVPTMGALHAGHMALVDIASREADAVVMSIFVNPKQFNELADFEKYPRTVSSDSELASSAGVHALYLPDTGTMYPSGFDTTVHVERTAAPLEGAGRPGHFDGVATVVTKLFTAVEPDVAVFGQKDYQQLAVVRRLVTDLDLPVRVIGAPTVREPDGLAMSSRNVRLSPQERAAAPVIKRALDEAAAALVSGSGAGHARDLFRRTVGAEPLARVEYVSVADPDSLVEIESTAGSAVVSCAVWFGAVRLIDNVLVGQ